LFSLRYNNSWKKFKKGEEKVQKGTAVLEPSVVTAQRLMNLIESNDFKKVMYGKDFSNAVVTGELERWSVAEGELIIRAKLPASDILEACIPLQNLEHFDAGSFIVVYDKFNSQGHIMKFGP
jgi:hypothetical protein